MATRLPMCLLAFLALAPAGSALQDGATTRVSVMTGCGKAPIGLGSSMSPAISEDGRFVVFSSFSTTLVNGDTSVAWFANLDGRGSFGPLLLITDELNKPTGLDIGLIDGDDRPDVLTSSFWDDRLAWYYNDLPGSGQFLGPQDISLAMDATTTVATADVDGDGDLDVLGTDIEDVSNKAVWFPNDGLGTLGEPVPISLHAVGTRSLFPADFDGDGDRDVAFNVEDFPGFIVWQENTTGLGDFGVVHTVTDQVKAAFSISGGDLDGDGDVDLLSASQDDDKIAWYRNTDGLGTFGPQLVLSTSSDHARSVRASDLDGDGDLDVLAASYLDDTVAWFENLDGAGAFGAEQVITATAKGARMALAADVDGDGDQDVVSTSFLDDVTAWYENLDGQAGAFAQHVIFDGSTVGATAVQVADVDGDGDADVVLASAYPNPDGIEVYRHDRDLLETVWVSKTVDGTLSDAANPAVSADGRFVAFESAFGHLVPEPDENAGAADIYLRDLVEGVTTRVDVSTAGVQANNVCQFPRLSGDGRYVAFVSYANNLVAGDPTCCNSVDAFLHDNLTGETTLIGRLPDGSWPSGTSDPDLSANGQHVAFVSGDVYAPDDTNAAADVFDLHLPTGTIERISLGTGGVQIVGGHCTRPSISADGRFVAFQTNAVVDPADTNVWQDVYVHDRATQVTQLASISMTGAGSNNTCTDPRISGDGRYVVFMTRATNLVAGTTGSRLRAYRRDLQTGQTALMGVASDGTEGNADILSADISGNGTLVTFDSAANNLVPTDTDTVTDVFVHDVEPWFPLGCDLPGSGGEALLAGDGPMQPDTQGKLSVSSASSSSLALLLVALQSQPLAFKGGQLVAWPAVLQAPLVLGPTGDLQLEFRWPAGVPAGTEVFFHVLIADPTTPEGVAFSSALRSVSQ